MSNPTVCCIMLTKDRPEMAARAVKCFREQAYEHKRLVIVDTGQRHCGIEEEENIWIPPFEPKGGRSATIGYLRNMATKFAAHHYTTIASMPEIFAHWDDDDWSHPNRLAEQVALLQASGADLVGYNECLFWDTRCDCRRHEDDPHGRGCCGGDRAWLYRYPNPAYCLGSSFMYWRKTWERQPFNDVNHGEDERMRLKVKSVGVSSVRNFGTQRGSIDVTRGGLFGGPTDTMRRTIPGPVEVVQLGKCEPRMICSIHGGNTSHYAPERDRAMWRRAENWDSTCERMMKL